MDYSLFTYTTATIRMFVLVYVDDIIVTVSNTQAIHHFIDKLKTEFQVKDVGELSYFLGIQALRNQEGLHLRQAKYITDLLHNTDMIGAKPLNYPSSSGPKLSSVTGNILPDPTDYRRVVGALQYCTITRPDIAYSVNQLCQFMHCPRDVHWKAVKRVLLYLKGIIDIGLYYVPGDIELNAYCDSDWAGDPDDRRNTTGYGVFLGTNLISWSSKKQGVVSRSSTEAEYRSMAHTTAELYWLRMIFHDLKITLPTTPNLWCDNIGAIALASNPVFHARMKHIEIDYHFIREKVINRDIQVKHISTKNQIADLFTKGHSATRFTLLRSNLSVCILPNSLRWGVRVLTATTNRSGENIFTVAAGLGLPSDEKSISKTLQDTS